jgi:hypothetical protein
MRKDRRNRCDPAFEPRKAILPDGSIMSYEDYIRSEHWTAVIDHYQASRLPQTCLACGCVEVDLHHRTYKRLGHEWLMDLVPLCRAHHQAVHVAYPSRRQFDGLWQVTKQTIRRARQRRRYQASVVIEAMHGAAVTLMAA